MSITIQMSVMITVLEVLLMTDFLKLLVGFHIITVLKVEHIMQMHARSQVTMGMPESQTGFFFFLPPTMCGPEFLS